MEVTRKNRWKVNSDWHEKVRNYCDHGCRAAWSLLEDTPHYKSFNTSRRVTGIDSVLRGEFTSSEPVTVAVPTGRLVESGDRASAPLTDPEPAGTAAAEAGPSRRRKKLVASSTSQSSASSSSEEVEEEEMLRHRGQRYAAEDLSAAAFGDIRGEALDPLQAASIASASTSMAAEDETPVAPVAETALAAVAEATPSA